MRRNKMNHLFALQGQIGVTEQIRHGWASGVLDKTATTYTALTVDEIDTLTAAAQKLIDASPDGDPYVLCGAPCPDGWPCVVDADHIARGEDHAREDGLAWAVR